jgi:glycyl-tRNA synthetase
LKQKFFYTPSFEIYGGVSGLYDYGPLGSQLKSNVEAIWRQHFVLEEDMLEVTCSNLTLDQVLETSVSELTRLMEIGSRRKIR